MAVGIDRQYRANQRRYEVYSLIVGKQLTKEEISALIEGSTPSSIRTLCDDMIIKGHVVSRKMYNKAIKRWVVLYSAVIGKPVKQVSYEQIKQEQEELLRMNSPESKRGKYDDLIAKNPALRVVKLFDKKIDRPKSKPKSYFRGIPSSLITLE